MAIYDEFKGFSWRCCRADGFQLMLGEDCGGMAVIAP